MKVHFEFSTADLAEVTNRTVNRSPLVRRWRLRSSVAGAVLMGLLVFVATPGDWVIRVAAGLGVAVVMCVILVSLLARRRGNMRLRQFYTETLGGDGPFTCEVELTASGVVSRQLGQETFHAWPHVASVAEVPGGIELVYSPIGSLLVRDRAFSDPQVKADFLSLARGFIPAGPQLEGPLSAIPEAPLATRSLTESDYLVAWLLFFLCATASTTLTNAVIGTGSAAIFRMQGAVAMYGAFVLGGISFVIGACFSYVFFRLFAKRLVYRAQANLRLDMQPF